MILDYMLVHNPVMLVLLSGAAIVAAVLALVASRLRRHGRR